jgi:hypothetical protein
MGWFFGVFGEKVGQAIEAALPADTSFDDPSFGGREHRWVDATGAYAADFVGAHQAAGFKDVQVLHDGREGHVQGLGELAHGSRCAAQAFDHGQAGGIGQGLEEPIEPRGPLVKHLLKYYAVAAQ